MYFHSITSRFDCFNPTSDGIKTGHLLPTSLVIGARDIIIFEEYDTEGRFSDRACLLLVTHVVKRAAKLEAVDFDLVSTKTIASAHTMAITNQQERIEIAGEFNKSDEKTKRDTLSFLTQSILGQKGSRPSSP